MQLECASLLLVLMVGVGTEEGMVRAEEQHRSPDRRTGSVSAFEEEPESEVTSLNAFSSQPSVP